MSVVVVGALSIMSAGGPAATTPSLDWQGVERVHVLCLVDAKTIDDKRLEPVLCERVRALAAEGASVPVTTIGFGDPRLIEPGAMALLVHGAVRREPGETTLLFTMRTQRGGVGAERTFFGAAPRAVRLPPEGVTGAVDASLRSALADTLPWSARPAGRLQNF